MGMTDGNIAVEAISSKEVHRVKVELDYIA